MYIFNKYPFTRLIFFITYLLIAIKTIIKNFAWFNIVISLLMLFGCYISLVKSGVIKDKNADGISSHSYDFISITITVYSLIYILRYII